MHSQTTARWLCIAGVLSIASALVAHRALDWWNVTSAAARLAIALSPVPFFVLFVVAKVHWVSKQDEFHRRVMLESLSIAFPVVIAEGVTVEALQSIGYLSSVSIGDLWPFMALSWVPALLIALRRYR